jgi:hypothetical protein
MSIVTAKAVKSNDANVPSQLWDARCELVVPGIAPFLPRLRLWILAKASHRMMSKFRAFLRKQHGPDWAVELVASRRSPARDRFFGTKTETRGGHRR